MFNDEAERIMEQSRSDRNTSYGVIRDFLANADDQAGMQSSIIYVAATPDTFNSEKGFPEYDALRSRLASSTRFSVPNMVDWRGVVVDLTKTPMQHNLLVSLAERVIDLHACARDWEPRSQFTPDFIAQIVRVVASAAFACSKPRPLPSWARTPPQIG